MKSFTQGIYLNEMRIVTCMIAAALALSACERVENAPGGRPPEEVMPDMEGTDGMSDMHGTSDGSTDMMGRMGDHLLLMQAMSGDSMRAMLATHRQMVANMLAQMNREMRDMNMAGDAAWNATVDSLRTDLAHMPRMDPAELQALMPGHRRRVMRLLEMHRDMMAAMAM